MILSLLRNPLLDPPYPLLIVTQQTSTSIVKFDIIQRSYGTTTTTREEREREKRSGKD
jgi:hypothetical protein